MDPRVIAFDAILGVAMLVAIAARRLHLPYSVGLALIGALLAFTRTAPPVLLTHELIYDLILPPLLFEASVTLHWSHLRKDLWTVGVLAIVGTLISAAVTTAGLALLLGWPLGSALVFGVLIAATDPVAVIALFKDQGVGGRLRLLVESESLFNDGVAAVLFAVALALVAPKVANAGTFPLLLPLVALVVGGVGIGAAVGGAAILVAGRTKDPLVETALTVVAAFGAFGIAEGLHVSGVLATVTAGLLMGNLGVLREGESPLTSQGRAFVLEFWAFVAFLANSMIFPLIGIAVASMPLNVLGAPALLAIIGVVLASRALSVYPLGLVFHPTRYAIARRDQHVLFWGGLRGALALALALALPPELAMRDQILVAAFGVAAFSIVVQGLTMPLLLRALGVKTHSAETG